MSSREAPPVILDPARRRLWPDTHDHDSPKHSGQGGGSHTATAAAPRRPGVAEAHAIGKAPPARQLVLCQCVS